MADHVIESRTGVSLSVGARIGVLVAGVLAVIAGVLFWSPIQLYPANTFPVQCGTAGNPPKNDLGKAVCGDVNVIRQWQAGGFAATSVWVLVGSVYAFGLRRRVEHRVVEAGETTPVTPGAAAG